MSGAGRCYLLGDPPFSETSTPQCCHSGWTHTEGPTTHRGCYSRPVLGPALDGESYLLRVLSGKELEVGHSGVLVSPQGIGGAAQEQRRQQFCVDAALLIHHTHNHLDTREP